MKISIDRDGTMSGYELELIKKVLSSVFIPVIARAVSNGGALAAGSFFVFHDRRAVLINFPMKKELGELFESNLITD